MLFPFSPSSRRQGYRGRRTRITLVAAALATGGAAIGTSTLMTSAATAATSPASQHSLLGATDAAAATVASRSGPLSSIPSSTTDQEGMKGTIGQVYPGR